MPVLVVGADHPVGRAIIGAFASRDGEVRAFISDAAEVEALKSQRVKVAIGDLSDGTHVGGAAINCFSLVFVTMTAHDERERAFAEQPAELFAQWQVAIDMSRVQRVIWVEDDQSRGSGHQVSAPEVAVVSAAGISPEATAALVADLDDLATLDGSPHRV